LNTADINDSNLTDRPAQLARAGRFRTSHFAGASTVLQAKVHLNMARLAFDEARRQLASFYHRRAVRWGRVSVNANW
jgi:hypothetical protein